MSVDVSLARLLEPGRIGPLALPNRMVMAPMGTGYASKDGFVTEQLIAYYAARARGGLGLVITEASGVDFPASMGRLNQPRSHDDRYLPGLARLAEAIHAGGARAAAQIFHAGRFSKCGQVGVQPVGPSAIAPPGGQAPRELSRGEIAAIVERFGDAARRMQAAGFDGVEIHGAHGYLISNFLSAAANRREDEYGGDIAGRARFLLEVIRAVRAAVSHDFAVWVRLNGEERGLPGGTDIEEAVAVSRMAEAAGADAIHISAFDFGYGEMVSATPRLHNFLLPLAARVKQAVGVPVIAVGRIDPTTGDMAIGDGQADFIAFGRSLFVDPELPRKVAEGALDDIRPCLSCLKCLDGLHLDGAIVCTVNAALGREAEGPPAAATRSRKVVVVGGGPAGMEAARVAALRGHRVVLFEQEPALGGQLVPGARPPGKDDIAVLNHHLAGQLAKVGVTVELGRPATAAAVAAEQPDAVVVATGSVPFMPDLPGSDAGHVVTALEVLAGSASVGERVVVIGGELVGCETAELLATAGKQVTVLRRGPEFAVKVNRYARLALLRRLADLGVRTLAGVRYEAITGEGVTIVRADGVRETILADTVVLATGGTPQRKLADELAGLVPEVHVAGDCAGPRSILEAIADGYRLGLQL